MRYDAGYADSSSCARPDPMAWYAASAASMPLFIAVWLPLIRAAFRKPASQPISAPPGNTSFGSDTRPPAVIARAPYDTRLPPSRNVRIAGCVL